MGLRWSSLFAGVAMVFAAFGGGRRGPRMGVDETWAWMLIGALSTFVLVLAVVGRRASRVVRSRLSVDGRSPRMELLYQVENRAGLTGSGFRLMGSREAIRSGLCPIPLPKEQPTAPGAGHAAARCRRRRDHAAPSARCGD